MLVRYRIGIEELLEGERENVEDLGLAERCDRLRPLVGGGIREDGVDAEAAVAQAAQGGAHVGDHLDIVYEQEPSRLRGGRLHIGFQLDGVAYLGLAVLERNEDYVPLGNPHGDQAFPELAQ